MYLEHINNYIQIDPHNYCPMQVQWQFSQITTENRIRMNKYITLNTMEHNYLFITL